MVMREFLAISARPLRRLVQFLAIRCAISNSAYSCSCSISIILHHADVGNGTEK
jgi:hypothetical protein